MHFLHDFLYTVSDAPNDARPVAIVSDVLYNLNDKYFISLQTVGLCEANVYKF